MTRTPPPASSVATSNWPSSPAARAGSVACERSTGRLTGCPVNVAAVDPTGAGDVFVASFMATGVLDWPIEQRLRLAGLAASLSVRTLGGAASAPIPARSAVPDRPVAAR